MITQDELKELLHYDPETGDFMWLVSIADHIKVGKIAGTLHKAGYIQIKIYKRCYLAHRLAWLYMTGSFVEEIDHKDRNKSNNKWTNLRKASSSQNHHNCDKQINNTSGYKGVHFRKDRNTWVALIRHDGQRTYLGSFKKKEDAAQVYNEAEKKYFGEFSNAQL